MRIEDVLLQAIHQLDPSKLRDAMEYSLMAGGKRIRPNLLYAVAHGYGIEDTMSDPFACALEMIHTYSLIHDDLPAMDDDDLRRGRPTCHKQFDEATAILAGDALLTYAFEVASGSNAYPAIVQQCISILAKESGPRGMIYGQVIDIEGDIEDFEDLKKIHEHKTGCLLATPLELAACLAKCSKEDVQAWRKIGILLGLAFQIQDDILDVELTAEEFGKSNSDERNEKKTSVVLLGKENASNLMQELYAKGKALIQEFKGFDSQEIITLIDEVIERRK